MRIQRRFTIRSVLLIGISLGVVSGCETLGLGDFSEHLTLRVPFSGEVPPQWEPPVASPSEGAELADARDE